MKNYQHHFSYEENILPKFFGESLDERIHYGYKLNGIIIIEIYEHKKKYFIESYPIIEEITREEYNNLFKLTEAKNTEIISDIKYKLYKSQSDIINIFLNNNS